MKPAWDQLADEYAASSSVLIADVDCTAEGESLCDEHGVQGYPTIKYFKDGSKEGEKYNGGRDLYSLQTFVKENLLIRCDVKDPKECSEKEKAYIEKMKTKSKEERAKQIERLEGMQWDAMKVELKQWLNQRLHILSSLEEAEL